MNVQNFIIESLKEASLIATKSFGKVISKIKNNDNNQVLTQTDLDIGKLIISRIQKKYPQDNIIDEETGVIDNKSSFTWVIDPVDGTSNFAIGLPMYGIMIGLLKEDKPIAGGVALPYFNEIYFAEKGKGAFCNNEKIQVTKENDLSKTLLAYAIDDCQKRPQDTIKEAQLLAEIIMNVRDYRTSNCCYDIMMTAKGKYSAWLNRKSMIWDNIAPHIIIEEANGVYTDFIGKKIDYSDSLLNFNKNYTICASNPIIHEKLQQIIKKYRFKD